VKEVVAGKDKSSTNVRRRDTPERKIAAVASAVLWTAGFFLAFVISPKSPYIWAPDLLLLLGFFPLLLFWKPAWPWMIFGACNLFIAFVLMVAKYLPDASLPAELRLVRAHLADYHAPLSWMFVGVISIIYGLIRMIKGWLRWIDSKRTKSD